MLTGNANIEPVEVAEFWVGTHFMSDSRMGSSDVMSKIVFSQNAQGETGLNAAHLLEVRAPLWHGCNAERIRVGCLWL